MKESDPPTTKVKIYKGLEMKILDATCGPKTIWYQKNHPFVTFMDCRKGIINRATENTKLKHRRTWSVDPDIVSEWKDAPFPDNYFDMIVFDPPQLIRDIGKKDSSMIYAYGKLYKDNWKKVLKEGIEKLFSILKPEGIFILKWSDTDKPVKEVIALIPYAPMFGTRVGQKNKTHWIMFLKYDVNMKLTGMTGKNENKS